MKGDNFITRTKDLSGSFDPRERERGKLLCVISYIFVLALIPLLSSSSTDYVRFHAKQGMILSAVTAVCVVLMNLASGFIRGMFGDLAYVLAGVALYAFLLYLVFLSALGISYAVRGRAKLLPGMSVFFRERGGE